MAVAIAAVVARPASAAFYSAQADIVFFNQPTFTKTDSGSFPAQADTEEIAAADGLRHARASGTADRGLVQGFGSAESNGSKITAIGQSNATYDDVIISWNGDGPPPDFASVDAALNYEIDAQTSTSGALGNTAGFNTRQIIYSVGFNGASDGGQIIWDPGGNSGQNLLGDHQLLSPQAPVNVPLTVTFSMFAGAQARLVQVGSPVTTGITAQLQVTGSPSPAQQGAGATLAALAATQLPGPVFDVPDGFTVNSVSMGIVDNRWVAAVPEPATALVGVLGVAFILCLRGERARGDR
jgi:hypothetical protein